MEIRKRFRDMMLAQIEVGLITKEQYLEQMEKQFVRLDDGLRKALGGV